MKDENKNKSSKDEMKKECPCPDCKCEKCECEEGKECVCENGKCKDCGCENCDECICEDKEKEKFEKILKQVQAYGSKEPQARGDDSEQWEHKYKRALADYQNLEKRVRDERVEWIKTANRDLLLRLLPVLDTFMLAQNHSDDKTIKVTIQQFLDVLKNEGVERIKTEGEEFSPHFMEAISTDEGEDGKVLKELRAGYKIGDKVLRVAQVVVGKKT